MKCRLHFTQKQYCFKRDINLYLPTIYNTTMIHITLPDGSIRAYNEALTVMDVAKDISEGFARNVISAQFNDIVVETTTLLKTDGNLI